MTQTKTTNMKTEQQIIQQHFEAIKKIVRRRDKTEMYERFLEIEAQFHEYDEDINRINSFLDIEGAAV